MSQKKPNAQENEQEFLAEVLKGHGKWTKKALAMKAAGLDSAKEHEFAQAYRILLTKFSQIQTE